MSYKAIRLEIEVCAMNNYATEEECSRHSWEASL